MPHAKPHAWHRLVVMPAINRSMVDGAVSKSVGIHQEKDTAFIMSCSSAHGFPICVVISRSTFVFE
jgi:hypothetical protein